MWIDAQVWEAYRDLCSHEKLRPSEPIEEYLRVILRNGSALTVLNMIQGMAKARSEGVEAHARVLLNWYTNEKHWIRVTDENDASVESMLLQALKEVADPQLRKEIQEALMIRRLEQARKRGESKSRVKEKPVAKEEPPLKPAAATMSERIGEIKKQFADHDYTEEQSQEFLKKIRQIREELKSNEKAKT
ncbi:MAG: hypothetical protein WCD81_11515 [Candidatus Bathyarchaeia archaeon]